MLRKTHVWSDAILLDDMAQIVADLRRRGNGFVLLPRLKPVGKSVHIAVRPDAGIAEQVPCPAQLFAAIEHDIVLAGQVHGIVRGHADSGNPGTDYHQIENFTVGH